MAFDYISWPIVIKLNPNVVTINDVEIPYMILAEMLNEITHPDPRKWIRLERIGDCVHVTIRMTEDEPHGTQIGNIGNGEADHGRQGEASPYPSPSHPQDS